MTKVKEQLLKDDLEELCNSLDSFSTYSFPVDLKKRMDNLELSVNSFAVRCGVSHTAVNKWLAGVAQPNSKEKMKALGIALEMDEVELNEFLFKNGYPKLYVKNPLDCAAKMLLRQRGGKADNIHLYSEILARLNLQQFAISLTDTEGVSTTQMSADFQESMREAGVSEWFEAQRDASVGQDLRMDSESEAKALEWFEAHREDFRGDAKRLRVDSEIKEYIQLYLGESPIDKWLIEGQIPVPLRTTLYELIPGRPVRVRALREKLIALGMQSNMTVEEIDFLLLYARLRPVTEVETKAEFARREAIYNAHDRYPAYEEKNLSAVKERLSELANERLKASVLEDVEPRLAAARKKMEYYRRHTTKGDEAFDMEYGTDSGHSVADYVYDVLSALKERHALDEQELAPLLRYLNPDDE